MSRYVTVEEVAERWNLDVESCKAHVLPLMRSRRVGTQILFQLNDRDGHKLHGRRMGHVYFVEAVGADRIKIGFTLDDDPAVRLRALSTGSPFPLVLLASRRGCRRTERDLHSRFAEHRTVGEWFVGAPALRAYLKRWA